MDKDKIRELVKSKRDNLDKETVKTTSLAIWKRLQEEEIFKNSKVIMSYMSFRNEIDTLELNKEIIRQGKTLVLPKVIDKTTMVGIIYSGKFEKNRFGIEEPVGKIYTGDIDLIIVPGIAFDKSKNRIGFGKGYYDRFLAKHPEAIKIAGLYEFQLFDEVEKNEHDIAMDILLLKNNVFYDKIL